MGQQFREKRPVSHVKNISKTEIQAVKGKEDSVGEEADIMGEQWRVRMVGIEIEEGNTKSGEGKAFTSLTQHFYLSPDRDQRSC